MRSLFSAGMEWVDIKHRKLVGVIDSLSWTFGNTVFAVIAYFVTDWRWLIVTVTSPVTLGIVTWRYDSKVRSFSSTGAFYSTIHRNVNNHTIH